MNILITNDDGIDAQGISVLAQAAADFGDVTVVAPAEQCSAMSHRITLSRRMRIEKRGMDIPHVTAYALDGTPADCVKAALDAILQGKPDVVLSGINHGYNVGFDVAYSGTVGAAMEAVMSGIPAIALSQNDVGSFDVARQYLHRILEELLPTAPSDREIWNVNFPTEHCNGILRYRFRGRLLQRHHVCGGGGWSDARPVPAPAAHRLLHPPRPRGQRPPGSGERLHFHRQSALPGDVRAPSF